MSLLLVVSCAASGGLHAALVPAHADQGSAPPVLFGVSAVLLMAVALAVERDGGRAPVTAAALVLSGLLAVYVASRVTAVWPLDHAEPVDALGAVTKLFEAAGLFASLRLLQGPRAATKELRAIQKGVLR